MQSNSRVAPGSEICPPVQIPVQTLLPIVDFRFPSSHAKQVTPFESVALEYVVYPARHTIQYRATAFDRSSERRAA